MHIILGSSKLIPIFMIKKIKHLFLNYSFGFFFWEIKKSLFSLKNIKQLTQHVIQLSKDFKFFQQEKEITK